MKITIHTLGSRGDVQPFIPLAKGLERAGYQIRFATFEAFREFVEGQGLAFYPIHGDPLDTMTSQAGQDWLRAGQNAIANATHMWRALTRTDNTPAFNDALEACRGSDAVLYSFMGATAYHVAEKLRIPSIFTLIQPFSRSRYLPSMIMPELPLGGWYNMLTHRISELTIWTIVKRLINPWRVETLGLPPMPWHGPFNTLYQNQMPYLYGFSPSVVPRPADWPSWHHISGYWFLDRDPEWAPPKQLIEFIESGPRPISIGFGSMTGKAAEELLQLTVESLRLTGQRAILLGGWANIDSLALPETVLQIGAVPHDWLFPLMSAVIHHGGSGTTAAGLRAGVPSILVPFFGDQPYWGRRVEALGVGPPPIQRKSITVKKLTQAIDQAINDQTMRQEAATLGSRIQTEDGVQSAVEFIQTYLEL